MKGHSIYPSHGLSHLTLLLLGRWVYTVQPKDQNTAQYHSEFRSVLPFKLD